MIVIAKIFEKNCFNREFGPFPKEVALFPGNFSYS
jgi:hypothetical protein